MSNPQDVNPYKAPASAGLLSSSFSSQAEAGVTPKIVEMLAKTQPWVRLLSVLAYVAVGLYLVGILAAVFLGARGDSVEWVFQFVFSGIVGALCLGPAVFLGRYASNIAWLRISHRTQDLEAALQSQKSFWKFAGIATLVVIVLYVLLIAVVAGLMFSDSPSGPLRIRRF